MVAQKKYFSKIVTVFLMVFFLSSPVVYAVDTVDFSLRNVDWLPHTAWAETKEALNVDFTFKSDNDCADFQAAQWCFNCVEARLSCDDQCFNAPMCSFPAGDRPELVCESAAGTSCDPWVVDDLPFEFGSDNICGKEIKIASPPFKVDYDPGTGLSTKLGFCLKGDKVTRKPYKAIKDHDKVCPDINLKTSGVYNTKGCAEVSDNGNPAIPYINDHPVHACEDNPGTNQLKVLSAGLALDFDINDVTDVDKRWGSCSNKFCPECYVKINCEDAFVVGLGPEYDMCNQYGVIGPWPGATKFLYYVGDNTINGSPCANIQTRCLAYSDDYEKCQYGKLDCKEKRAHAILGGAFVPGEDAYEDICNEDTCETRANIIEDGVDPVESLEHDSITYSCNGCDSSAMVSLETEDTTYCHENFFLNSYQGLVSDSTGKSDDCYLPIPENSAGDPLEYYFSLKTNDVLTFVVRVAGDAKIDPQDDVDEYDIILFRLMVQKQDAGGQWYVVHRGPLMVRNLLNDAVLYSSTLVEEGKTSWLEANKKYKLYIGILNPTTAGSGKSIEYKVTDAQILVIGTQK